MISYDFCIYIAWTTEFVAAAGFVFMWLVKRTGKNHEGEYGGWCSLEPIHVSIAILLFQNRFTPCSWHDIDIAEVDKQRQTSPAMVRDAITIIKFIYFGWMSDISDKTHYITSLSIFCSAHQFERILYSHSRAPLRIHTDSMRRRPCMLTRYHLRSIQKFTQRNVTNHSPKNWFRIHQSSHTEIWHCWH